MIRVVFLRITSSSSLMCRMLYGCDKVVLCFFNIFLENSRTPKIEVIIVGYGNNFILIQYEKKRSHVNLAMKTMHMFFAMF